MRFSLPVSGIGAANMDIHGRSLAGLVLRDSNPGHMAFSPGGVTRNILENYARLGGRCRLLTAVGDDANADAILRSCQAVEIDTSDVLHVPGHSSSTYMAMLEPNGDMYLAMSDMRVLHQITPEWLETKKDTLRASSLVVCDPCLTEEALGWITGGSLKGVPLFADPVSTAYAAKLRPYAQHFYCLKPNVMELSVLSGISVDTSEDIEKAAGILLERGTHCIAVSRGADGCYWADRDGNHFFAKLPPVKNMTDATGAGDAFLAGLMWAYIHEFSAAESVHWALAAGIAAVTSNGAVSEGMSEALLSRILEESK